MQDDYWIYQEQRADVRIPWALYIVYEYSYKYRERGQMSATVYHEDIPNAMHSVSRYDMEFRHASEYASEIVGMMAESVAENDNAQLVITSDDMLHIEKRLDEIIRGL